jgi:thymidylate synthase (FAD)
MSISSRLDASKDIEDFELQQSTKKALGDLLNAKAEGKLIECLDDGFVRLVDHMGDDSAIVQAARVSYGAGTKSVSDDRSLIRYLMKNRHTTPFEMIEFKFHVRVPMDCWRQWIRTRTASVNEYSTRYSEAIDSMQAVKTWRCQSTTNKQGSSEQRVEWPDDATLRDISAEEYLSNREAEFHQKARDLYKERLAFGIAREQARKDLPLSTYTEAYWKIDGHNLLHFLGLRMDGHAQQEIREYAYAIWNLIRDIVPFTCEAFEDYRLDAMTFSQVEIWELCRILHPDKSYPTKSLGTRERKEFLEKLNRLDL